MDTRRRRPKFDQTICRKHPKHRQSPGVCSVCVTEKLATVLSKGVPRRTKTVAICSSSSSSSSSLSSLSSLSSSSEISSYSSPVHFRAKIGLTKSKSSSVAQRRGGGFLSRLLGRRRSDQIKIRVVDDDRLMHYIAEL